MDQPKTYTQTLTVSAIQWTLNNEDAVDAFLHNGSVHHSAGWVKGSYVEIGIVRTDGQPSLAIAKEGDWIIRKEGDVYEVMHDVEFKQMYQEK